MPPRKHRPRGHIEELASGSRRVVVYAGIDPLTRRERRLKETTKTYAAAKLALTKLQGQVDDEKHPKTNITVAQAIEQWLDVAKLAETTRDRYDDLIRIYILPTFGDLPAAKLDAEILERFYGRLQRCRVLCDGRTRRGHVCRPLSGSTVRQIHHVISGALERAVRWRHLSLNQACFAVPPSPNRPAPHPPSAEEAARLLSAASEDPDWGLPLWLTMTTGRRRGEVCALRVRIVDFERAQLIVDRSLVHPRAGVIEKETKAAPGHESRSIRTRCRCSKNIASECWSAAPASAATFPRTRSCSRFHRMDQSHTSRGRSASATDARRSSSAYAVPASTPCGTIRRRSSSQPVSTSAPWPAGSVKAAAGPRRCASTPRGSVRPTAARLRRWPASSAALWLRHGHRAAPTR